MSSHPPLSTIFSVPPRRQGQISIKVDIAEVKAISYHGVVANLPDNISKRAGAILFNEINQVPLYRLKSNLASQVEANGAKMPDGFIVEEIRPQLCDLIVSIEGNVSGIRWLTEASSMTALSTAFEQLFVNETYLANLNVASVKLRASVEPEEAEACIREYENGLGFVDIPSQNDIQLWTQIELYHVDKIRQHLHWAREKENWLESSLGSFLMTCKQLLPNNEPLTDAGKLERTASKSSRASVDKVGMTSFANAFRHMVKISAEMADQIIDKLNHTHRFERKYPALYQIRCKTIELVLSMQKTYSTIMDVGIIAPNYPIYDPWRSKVLAKEAELYLPLVSVIPFFKDHLLDVDVHMDELKAHLTSSFPVECRVLSEVVASQPKEKDSVEKPSKQNRST